jgi:hypothetical protein
MRDRLRRAHADWQAGGLVGGSVGGESRSAWIAFVLTELLGWGDAVSFGDFASLSLEVPEHEAVITPSFTLTDPASGGVCLLGLVSDDSPVARMRGSDWPATPADRLAQLCRARGIELGLATDGPLVDAGLGTRRRSHHGGSLRRDLLAGFFGTDRGPGVPLPARTPPLVRCAGGAPAARSAPGVAEASGGHHRAPGRPGPPVCGAAGRGIRAL